MSPAPIIDIDQLSFEKGAHILLKRALQDIPVGGKIGVRGSATHLDIHLKTWCRIQAHEFELNHENAGDNKTSPVIGWVTRGNVEHMRWENAEQAGQSGNENTVVDYPKGNWGLAARSAVIEAGSPEFHFNLSQKSGIWAEEASRIYKQALAAQWDPNTAIDWNAPIDHPPEIEQAVVQIMTYLIENENAALLVPARFLGQIHPHFREVIQTLAIQVADEARHIEIFTRRALLTQDKLGFSTVGGQTSLKTLFEESDFATASFLLSVLGEGTFLNLLHFLHEFGPDPVTRQITRLAAKDEARHVAFGMGHLHYHLNADSGLRQRLANAIERRHDALIHTSGLNEEVYDALILLAAGKWTPEAIASGHDRVKQLETEMANGRHHRLEKLGFKSDEAEKLAALHTRNFM